MLHLGMVPLLCAPRMLTRLLFPVSPADDLHSCPLPGSTTSQDPLRHLQEVLQPQPAAGALLRALSVTLPTSTSDSEPNGPIPAAAGAAAVPIADNEECWQLLMQASAALLILVSPLSLFPVSRSLYRYIYIYLFSLLSLALFMAFNVVRQLSSRQCCAD